MALSDYGKICWAAWYPFNNHSFIKAHTSLPSKCLPPFESSVQYILHSIKPRKMSRYQCVCVQSFLLVLLACACVFLSVLWVCFCVCVVPKAYQLGLSLTWSPYTRAMWANGKGEESDLYIVWHPCPSISHHHLPAAKRPLTESRHLPKMPPLGISTRADTHLRIHNERNWRHTVTHLGAKRREREDTVMGETDMERLIREWECVVLLWLTSGCKRICDYLDARGPEAVDSPAKPPAPSLPTPVRLLPPDGKDR